MTRRMKRALQSVFLSLGIALLFTLLILFVDRQPIGPVNTEVGFSALNGAVHSTIGERPFFYRLTGILGYAAIAFALFMAALGAFQLLREKSLSGVDRFILALGCLYVATGLLYCLFEIAVVNFRPVLMEGESVPEASFPSSHTMLACVIYGSALMCCPHFFKNRALCSGMQVLFGALIVISVIGRLLSGVHWFTDIAGALLYSAFLLCCFRFFLALFREQRRERS